GESHRRERPGRDALQVLNTHGNCRIEVETSDGVVGKSSINFGRLDAAPAVLAHPINGERAPPAGAKDPSLIGGIRDELWAVTDYHGTVGLALMGIAGIDIALWDAIGKTLGQPVWRLLGAKRDRVPSYAMVGWLELDVDGLRRICVEAVERG